MNIHTGPSYRDGNVKKGTSWASMVVGARTVQLPRKLGLCFAHQGPVKPQEHTSRPGCLICEEVRRTSDLAKPRNNRKLLHVADHFVEWITKPQVTRDYHRGTINKQFA